MKEMNRDQLQRQKAKSKKQTLKKSAVSVPVSRVDGVRVSSWFPVSMFCCVRVGKRLCNEEWHSEVVLLPRGEELREHRMPRWIGYVAFDCGIIHVFTYYTNTAMR